jgi:Flp pilus assembly protein TadD
MSAEQAHAQDAFEAGAGKPPTAATMYTLARILMAKGDTVQAIVTLRNLLQRYPNYGPAYNALAEAYLSTDRTDDALAALKAGVARVPQDPILLNNLGMAYFLQGDYESALTNFDRAVAIAPGEQMYTSNKAAALGMLGRVTEAADLYRKHLRKADVNENIGVLVRARSAANAMNSPAQRDADVLEATRAATQPSASVGQTAEPRVSAAAAAAR